MDDDVDLDDVLRERLSDRDGELYQRLHEEHFYFWTHHRASDQGTLRGLRLILYLSAPRSSPANVRRTTRTRSMPTPQASACRSCGRECASSPGPATASSCTSSRRRS